MNNNIFCENIEVDIWSHKNIHHTSILMKLEIRHMPKAIQKYRKIIFKDRKKYGFYICNFSKKYHPSNVCVCFVALTYIWHHIWYGWLLTSGCWLLSMLMIGLLKEYFYSSHFICLDTYIHHDIIRNINLSNSTNYFFLCRNSFV